MNFNYSSNLLKPIHIYLWQSISLNSYTSSIRNIVLIHISKHTRVLLTPAFIMEYFRMREMKVFIFSFILVFVWIWMKFSKQCQRLLSWKHIYMWLQNFLICMSWFAFKQRTMSFFSDVGSKIQRYFLMHRCTSPCIWLMRRE